MHYVFISIICLTMLIIVMLNMSRQKNKTKAGATTLQRNIIELSRRGKK